MRNAESSHEVEGGADDGGDDDEACQRREDVNADAAGLGGECAASAEPGGFGDAVDGAVNEAGVDRSGEIGNAAGEVGGKAHDAVNAEFVEGGGDGAEAAGEAHDQAFVEVVEVHFFFEPDVDDADEGEAADGVSAGEAVEVNEDGERGAEDEAPAGVFEHFVDEVFVGLADQRHGCGGEDREAEIDEVGDFEELITGDDAEDAEDEQRERHEGALVGVLVSFFIARLAAEGEPPAAGHVEGGDVAEDDREPEEEHRGGLAGVAEGLGVEEDGGEAEFFGVVTAEEGRGADGEDGDEERAGGDGEFFPEAAHVFDVLLVVHGVNDGA